MKAPKPPPLPPPAAIPTVGEESEDVTKRKARRKSGYEKTLMTGNLTSTTGGKTQLG